MFEERLFLKFWIELTDRKQKFVVVFLNFFRFSEFWRHFWRCGYFRPPPPVWIGLTREMLYVSEYLNHLRIFFEIELKFGHFFNLLPKKCWHHYKTFFRSLKVLERFYFICKFQFQVLVWRGNFSPLPYLFNLHKKVYVR